MKELWTDGAFKAENMPLFIHCYECLAVNQSLPTSSAIAPGLRYGARFALHGDLDAPVKYRRNKFNIIMMMKPIIENASLYIVPKHRIWRIRIGNYICRFKIFLDHWQGKRQCPTQCVHKQLVHVKVNCITQLESIYAMCCLLAHVRLNINIMF